MIEHLMPPDGPLPAGPPARTGIAGEWRTPLQLARLVARSRSLARAPRGDGGPVVLVPGWRAPEASMAPIRAYLRRLGHDANHWGLGVNRGHPERDARRLADQVQQLAAERSRPVALVGWSLGGTISRECARLVPEAVGHVVTYGTPAVGGPTHTIGASAYSREESERIAALVERLDTDSPIGVPITNIFTRRDGVVSWAACIDRLSPNVRHVEVASTHLSMGIDPDVWLTVATCLAPRPTVADRAEGPAPSEAVMKPDEHWYRLRRGH